MVRRVRKRMFGVVGESCMKFIVGRDSWASYIDRITIVNFVIFKMLIAQLSVVAFHFVRSLDRSAKIC